MTGTTAQKPSADDGDRTPPAAPRLPLALVRGRARPWSRAGRWPPCSASASPPAPAPRRPPRRREPPAPPRTGARRVAMARPTVAGKITAVSGDDITVRDDGSDAGHRRHLVRHHLQDQTGAERRHHVERVRAQGRRLHRGAGHQEQRRHRDGVDRRRSAGRPQTGNGGRCRGGPGRAAAHRRRVRLPRDALAPPQHLVLARLVVRRTCAVAGPPGSGRTTAAPFGANCTM